jgi:hypothetical protein
MKLPPVAWLSRGEQTGVMWQLLLTLSNNQQQQQQQQRQRQRINSVAAVHYWFCTQQRALAQHCALISAAAPLYSPLNRDDPPAAMDTSDDTATRTTTTTTGSAIAVEAAHLSLLAAVAQALLPSSGLWHSDSAVALWARTTTVVLHAAPAVLAACSSRAAACSQEYSTVRETWRQLALTMLFVTDVAVPLQLRTAGVLTVASRLCEIGLIVRSCTGLERVVQSLMEVKHSSSSDAPVHACISR